MDYSYSKITSGKFKTAKEELEKMKLREKKTKKTDDFSHKNYYDDLLTVKSLKKNVFTNNILKYNTFSLTKVDNNKEMRSIGSSTNFLD